MPKMLAPTKETNKAVKAETKLSRIADTKTKAAEKANKAIEPKKTLTPSRPGIGSSWKTANKEAIKTTCLKPKIEKTKATSKAAKTPDRAILESSQPVTFKNLLPTRLCLCSASLKEATPGKKNLPAERKATRIPTITPRGMGCLNLL